MITYERARQLAGRRIGEGQLGPYGVTPAIIDTATRETDLGWVFFYNSKEYLESGDFSRCLAGNAPLFVSKLDGTIYVTGTARSVEDYIDEIERRERARTS